MVVEEPTVFEQGKLGFWQGNTGGAYYFNGEMVNTYYGGTTSDFASAKDLTVLKTQDNKYIIKIDGTNQYIGAVKSGTHSNFEITDTEYLWNYNVEYDAYTTDVGNGEVYLGTYENFNSISLSKMDTIEDNFVAHITDDVITAPEATNITISANPTTIKVGGTTELNYKLSPTGSQIDGEITYEVIGTNDGVVSLEENIVTGLKEGSVQIVVKIGKLTSEPITIKVITEDTPVGKSVVYKYEPAFDSTNGNISNNAYNSRLNEASDVLNTLNDIDGEESPNLISAVSNFDNVFRSSTPNSGIKFSTGSLKGTLTFSTSLLVSKIDVTYIGWAKDTPSLEIKVGNDEPIKQGSTEATDGLTEETFTYTFTTPSKEFEFAAGKASKCRFVITKLEFWLA